MGQVSSLEDEPTSRGRVKMKEVARAFLVDRSRKRKGKESSVRWTLAISPREFKGNIFGKSLHSFAGVPDVWRRNEVCWK